MSNIEVYPKNSYFLVANGAETELGSYVLSSDGDLSIAQLRVFNRTITSYSYQLRLVLSSRAAGPALVTSEWLDFSSTTTGQTTTDWLGDVVFSFPEYSLFAGEAYFIRLETSGYSRGVEPFQNDVYLSVWCDWMQPVGTDDTSGARIALGVKR